MTKIFVPRFDYINKFSKKQKLFFSILLFIIISILYFVYMLTFNVRRNQVSVFENRNHSAIVHEITNDKIIEQSFISQFSSIRSISFMFGTYVRKNSGKMILEILQDGAIIASSQINLFDIPDNSYYPFKFDKPVKLDKGQQYVLRIFAPESSTGDAVALYKTDKTSLNSMLSVNGQQEQGNLVVNFSGTNKISKSYLCKLGLSFLLFIFIFFQLIYFLVLKKYLYLEKIVLSVFLFGLLYSIIITPLSIPDETYHYSSSLVVSNYLLLRFSDPLSVEKDLINYSNFVDHSNVASAFLRYKDLLFIQNRELVELGTRNSSQYPIQHLPQAIGVTLARIFQLNFMGVFFLGRLFNLLFYCVCVFFALKYFPYEKVLLLPFIFFPISLQQAASFSYDGFINGVSLLLICMILHYVIISKIISKKDLIIIFVLSCILAPAKVIYFILSFLVILIPSTSFKTKKKSYIYKVGLICITIFFLYFFNLASRNINLELNHEGQKNYSVSFIVNNPVETINIFIRTIKNNASFYYVSLIGVLSGLSLPLPMWIIDSFAFLFLLCCIDFKDKKGTIKLRYRLVYMLISISIFFLVLLSMFLLWTSDTRNIIEGVQGRYFIPILPLVMLVFQNNFFTIKLDKNIFIQFIITSLLILQFFSMNYIINYTFM